MDRLLGIDDFAFLPRLRKQISAIANQVLSRDRRKPS